MRIRTGNSFRTAVGHLPDVMSRLKDIGWKVAPISDRLSTFGYAKWTKLAKTNGMRPIYGVELGVSHNPALKRPPMDYWTFFATENLVSLHELVHHATKEGIGKEPNLLYHEAIEAKGVIKIAGNFLVPEKLPKKIPKDFYVALSPSTPIALYREIKKRKIPFIAASDNNFPRQDDLEFYRVALRRSSTQTYPQWILSDEEWKDACWFADPADLKSAIKNRDAAFKRCTAVMRQADILRPKITKTLRQMCVEGAKKKSVDLKEPVYKARLDRELALIEEKKFEDYFFVIADMVQWAKQRMLVGPARGSSCGSLVCFLLDITAVDPIPYGLLFERFIDINRSDLPDIDIDFSDTERHLVFEYATKKYGKGHIARLGTVGSYQPRSALNQAAFVYRIPKWRVEKLADQSPDEIQIDDKTLSEFPELSIAHRLVDHPTNPSQHAAGIVITQEPVINFVAIDARTNSTMCDKYDAEAFNLLKIDALGLTQLSVMERTFSLIGVKDNPNEFLSRIPLDDPAAFEIFNQQRFSGVFQFNGSALQSLAKLVEVSRLEDIVSLTALARPGPLASGEAHAWVRRKNGQERIAYPHPLFEPILEPTLGTMVYQEQVMRIGRDIGDLSWEQVTGLRKALSKSMGPEAMNVYGEPWKAAARQKGIPLDVIDKVWSDICSHGSYSFNRSHAVAYGIVSYHCAWLKAHHPVEFAAASLDAESNPATMMTILREIRKEGVDYVPVDPDVSTDRWELTESDGKRVLVGPLSVIDGIGPVAMRDIVTLRREGKKLPERLRKRLENVKTSIDTLEPIKSRLGELYPDGLHMAGVQSEPTPIEEIQMGYRGMPVAIGVITRANIIDENEPQRVLNRKGRRYTGQTQALNMFIRDDSGEIFAKIDRSVFDELSPQIMDKVRIGKSIFALKGTVPNSFRMISVQRIKYIGEMDDAP